MHFDSPYKFDFISHKAHSYQRQPPAMHLYLYFSSIIKQPLFNRFRQKNKILQIKSD